MTAYLVIGLVAFFVSVLTLFAGFGLGTLLLPTFALFVPLEVAVAATAVVHLANSLFKLTLLYRLAVPRILLRFGLPAIGAAFFGALALGALSGRAPLWVWKLGTREAAITPVGAVMGVLILGFALIDLLPRFRSLRFDPRWLPFGGLLSGFFGGLSGHQGALRAAFLLPLGLDPPRFAGTQAALAAMVDVARIAVYGTGFMLGRMGGLSTPGQWRLVAVAIVCAFAGAVLGWRLLPRVTLDGLRWLTGSLLLIVALGLISGLL